VGTEIYYHTGGKIIPSRGWERVIRYKWESEKIENLLETCSFLRKQLDLRRFKLSYYLVEKYDIKYIRELRRIFKTAKLSCKIIVTEERLVDIIPKRASKLQAILYLCKQWDISIDQILVAGDAGNDKEMLRIIPKSVVVANHQKELRGLKNIYYAQRPYAGAILEAIEHYHFMEELHATSTPG